MLLFCELALVVLPVMASQHVLGLEDPTWMIDLSRDWDVLGPFPIHAREQHFLSPSFPLNLSEPVDLNRTYPSSYADGGEVTWSTARASETGALDVTFPNIRWEPLRAIEGWAALQHHAILRTLITLHPPEPSSAGLHTEIAPPQLSVNLIQGSFFTVVPHATDEASIASSNPVKWYSGNIYDIERAVPQLLPLPTPPSSSEATKYWIYVSGDYEIRLFGDPVDNLGQPVPVQKLQISVALEAPVPQVRHVATHDIVPDIVGGYLFGGAIGIGLQSLSGWWTFAGFGESDEDELKISIHPSVEATSGGWLAPTQTRILPLFVFQFGPLKTKTLKWVLVLQSDTGARQKIPVTLNLTHFESLEDAAQSQFGIKSTYFAPDYAPIAFYAIPPTSAPKVPSKDTDTGAVGSTIEPPLLAIHGAGVDIFASGGGAFWMTVLPRRARSWIIVPSGRTSWGLDWHGPSSVDAWANVDAIATLLSSRSEWKAWAYPTRSRVVLIGHSNGGQGVWWNAGRFPDRVIAAIPAAGYIKSQAYVSLSMSRSAHYIDPALRAIMEASLTPDDDDLFLTNLHGIPVLAIHGGADPNVPTWHSREAVSVVKTLYPDNDISLIEDAGGVHWYDGMLDRPEVHAFLDLVLANEPKNRESRENAGTAGWTMTVANPYESGSMYGIKMLELVIRGRLGRLQHSADNSQGRFIHLRSTNIRKLSIPQTYFPVIIDGSKLTLNDDYTNEDTIVVERNAGTWTIATPQDTQHLPQPSGRLQLFLTSAGLIDLFVRDEAHAISLALRIAHDLDTYHKIGSQIILATTSPDGEPPGRSGRGNAMFIGVPEDPFIINMLGKLKTPTMYDKQTGILSVGGHSWKEKSIGLLALLPGVEGEGGNTVLLVGTDSEALERMARLVAPFRTGVAVPDWLVMGPNTHKVGAAAVLGAGLWANDWKWSEESSFMQWL